MLHLTDSDLVFDFSIMIGAPCQDIFDLLADLGRASEIAGSRKTNMITNKPITVGTKWISTSGSRKHYTTITNFDRPRKITRQVNGDSMTGTIEDVFEPIENMTKVTRKVNVTSNEFTEDSLKSSYIGYFEKLKDFLERSQLERDAQDQTIIEATRARIKGQMIVRPKISQKIQTNREASGLLIAREEQTNYFGSEEYEHAQVMNSGPGFSKILEFIFGPVDVFIICLCGRQDLLYRKGVAEFCIEAPRVLSGWFRRSQIVLPKQGHEESYWNDATSLLEKPELDDPCIHIWNKEKCFLIMTRVRPIEFKYKCFPLLSIDITDILPSEVPLLLLYLKTLCSKNRLIPFGTSKGYGKPLFEQNLALLPEGGPNRTKETAFDTISIPLMVIPTMTIDFKYFNPEIRRRFESVCEETLYSRPWAAPFTKTLEFRRKFHREPWNSRHSLPEEVQIREIWK